MTERLAHVEIDETGLPPASPEQDQERRVAAFDLMEASSFALPGGAAEGPYRLRLGRAGETLRFEVGDATGREAADFTMALGPLAQIAKDYRNLCASYAEAIKTLPSARIEAIDAARREIHLEAARALRSRLEGRVRIDEATARHLFTLVCAIAPEN